MIEPRYQSDKVTLYCADCLDVLPQLEPGSADAVITDPPYGNINHIDRLHERAKYKNGPIRKLHKGKADDSAFDWEIMLNLVDRVSREWIYIFAGDNSGFVRSYFTERDCMTRIGVWEKTNPTPLHGQYIWLSSVELCAIARKHRGEFNRFCASPVWRLPSGTSNNHPTEKPIRLMTELICSSTRMDSTILDPFMGSGTTGVACMQTGRKFIGIEIDEKYYAIAEKRIRAAEAQLLLGI